MEDGASLKLLKKGWFVAALGRGRGVVVPDEGIEPPTFGLQNRCSTAELIRHFVVSGRLFTRGFSAGQAQGRRWAVKKGT